MFYYNIRVCVLKIEKYMAFPVDDRYEEEPLEFW